MVRMIKINQSQVLVSALPIVSLLSPLSLLFITKRVLTCGPVWAVAPFWSFNQARMDTFDKKRNFGIKRLRHQSTSLQAVCQRLLAMKLILFPIVILLVLFQVAVAVDCNCAKLRDQTSRNHAGGYAAQVCSQLAKEDGISAPVIDYGCRPFWFDFHITIGCHLKNTQPLTKAQQDSGWYANAAGINRYFDTPCDDGQLHSRAEVSSGGGAGNKGWFQNVAT